MLLPLISKSDESKLSEHVLSAIAGEYMHDGEKIALSVLRRNLEGRGWRGFGDAGQFIRRLKALGFTLQTKGSSTYVTV